MTQSPDIAPESDQHKIITGEAAKPAPGKGVVGEISRFLCGSYLKLSGWQMAGAWPDIPKAVLLAAPHTSNWDGFNMVAAAGFFRIDLKWMGKKELTTGPLGWIARASGCVPVDREGGQDTVGQMTQAFADTDAMILAISPEGTRAKTPGWRSGFYHIAHQAGVPIIFSVLDYGTKTIRISGYIWPSGNYEEDLLIIRSHYTTARGLINDRFTS